MSKSFENMTALYWYPVWNQLWVKIHFVKESMWTIHCKYYWLRAKRIFSESNFVNFIVSNRSVNSASPSRNLNHESSFAEGGIRQCLLYYSLSQWKCKGVHSSRNSQGVWWLNALPSYGVWTFQTICDFGRCSLWCCTLLHSVLTCYQSSGFIRHTMLMILLFSSLILISRI